MSDIDVGRRVEALRRRKGLSREALAGLAECSASLIKSIEMGRRNLTLTTAQRLAPILDVRDLSEFYGPAVQLTLDAKPLHDGLPEVRRALTSWHLHLDGQPESVDYLRGALDAGWRTWHTSKHQRSDVAALLPTLLDQAQRAARLHTGTDQQAAAAILAEAYHLAQAYLAWHGDRELLFLAVDRGMHAALASGDPVTIGGAIWYAAHVWRNVGRSEESLHQLAEARELVAADGGDVLDERHLAMLIDLWLCSALTRARSRDLSAWADWEHAHDLAQQLPATYVHPWTRASRAIVEVYGIQVATDLGDVDDARRRSQNLDPETIPSVERRARHYIELARAQVASAEAQVQLLLKAAEVSPDVVAHTPASRDIIRRLMTETPASVRSEVDQLARITGVTPS